MDAFRFDEWFTGYGYLEDVDYSIRVSRLYSLRMVAEARARHESEPIGWRQHYRFGIWQVTNRLYLIRKHPELSGGWCAWSLVGQLLLNVTSGVTLREMCGLIRALGNLVGWFQVAVGLIPGRTNTP